MPIAGLKSFGKEEGACVVVLQTPHVHWLLVLVDLLGAPFNPKRKSTPRTEWSTTSIQEQAILPYNDQIFRRVVLRDFSLVQSRINGTH
jgi:hypothetical protein